MEKNREDRERLEQLNQEVLEQEVTAQLKEV